MTVQCGIIGLPNIGKSTLFNALTKAGAASANYPFCTIDPNIGIVDVPDKRLDTLTKLVNSKKIIPASHMFVDIAGLVRGASKGEGLGNAFLANIRETDAIIQVIRCFEEKNIVHVDGNINPERDFYTINAELIIKDLEVLEKAIERHNKFIKAGNKESQDIVNILTKLANVLNNGLLGIKANLSQKELLVIKSFGLLTIKPMLLVGNIEENYLHIPEKCIYYQQLMKIADENQYQLIPICSKLEAELQELSEIDRIPFLKDLDLKETGLDKLIRESFKLLGLQTYFTVGPKEIRAWTIPIGATASEAAGVIHTDFQKGFIRAQTISYDDYIKYGGEQGAKEAGKLRSEGKEYIVQDGDIMHFLFNV